MTKKKKTRFFGKNNRQLWLLSFLILLSLRGLQAQVMIGELQDDPQSYSVLELSTKNIKGGLRLPQLSEVEKQTLNVSGDTLANGLTIYNKDAGKDYVQFWNSKEWVRLLDGDNPEILFSTGPFISVGATVTTAQSVTTSNASCSTTSEYEYKLVIGSDYCELIQTGSNTFTIQFKTPNDRTSARKVIVAVKDPCSHRSAYFIAKQEKI